MRSFFRLTLVVLIEISVLVAGSAPAQSLGPFAADNAPLYLREGDFAILVAYRIRAMSLAFGIDFASVVDPSLQVELVTARQLANLDKAALGFHYDASRHTLVFNNRILRQRLPEPLNWALQYWPYYEDPGLRPRLPVIAEIDRAVWHTFMKQTALHHDRPWPPDECYSHEVHQRLPCEMLLVAVDVYVSSLSEPVLNENRIDTVWPERLSELHSTNWRISARKYARIRQYGGLVLLRPLIREFGVPRTLAYVARTPFQMDGENLYSAAMSYQQTAKSALR